LVLFTHPAPTLISTLSLHDALPISLSPIQDGVASALLARAEPQIVRLALNLALLDLSPIIDLSHIKAAQAIWRYCSDTVHVLFGDRKSTRLNSSHLVISYAVFCLKK